MTTLSEQFAPDLTTSSSKEPDILRYIYGNEKGKRVEIVFDTTKDEITDYSIY